MKQLAEILLFKKVFDTDHFAASLLGGHRWHVVRYMVAILAWQLGLDNVAHLRKR